MKFAFSLVKYFPYGGLQRDFLRIARACQARGHHVEVYTSGWEGPEAGDLPVHLISCRGWTNHARRESFATQMRAQIPNRSYDAVVGFNKLPGLDVYYAADPCYAELAARRSPVYRMTARCRTYLSLERAVFDRTSRTRILAISERQMHLFRNHYRTPSERFFLLPPGIGRDRVVSGSGMELRAAIRRELGAGSDHHLVLMVGTGFKRKGVDRAIRALAALSDNLRAKTRLVILGENKLGPYRRLSRRLNVSDQVHFLGGRDDVPRFMAAADLLVHPALVENTGTVLIEAMAAGLPVLASAVCGYSDHILAAEAGEIVPHPFDQTDLNRLLERMLRDAPEASWGSNGRSYVARTDVFSLHRKAAEIIEQVAGC